MQILFQGPHVKMGIYRGRPTGVSPHVTTGRADYFGPFVNRSVQLSAASGPLLHNSTRCMLWSREMRLMHVAFAAVAWLLQKILGSPSHKTAWVEWVQWGLGIAKPNNTVCL